MQVYSDSIHKFLLICKNQAKTILSKEMNLSYSRSRLKWKKYTIPLNFVVFEHESQLGFFNHHLYQIGLNKRLLLVNDEVLLNDVIKHELAHLVTFLIHSRSVDDHGREYREVCKSYNWGEAVYSAKIILKEKLPTFEKENVKHDKLKSKITKLLNLASSDNINESHLATAKANELLLKYNLSHSDIEEDEETCLLKVLEGKRVTSKAKAIYEILTTFNVQPVFNHGKGHYYLEIIGTRASVELGDYVCSYLERELELLWAQTRVENPKLKGQTAKNSFFRGLADGYKESIIEQQVKVFTKKELITLRNDLESRIKNVYGRLSHSKSSSVKNDTLSSKLGKKSGKNLKIKEALSNLNPIKLLK